MIKDNDVFDRIKSNISTKVVVICVVLKLLFYSKRKGDSREEMKR